MSLRVDRMLGELRCTVCDTSTVIDLPELILPARHERYGHRVYYSPETRLIDWPAVGEQYCPQCGSDVMLSHRGHIRCKVRLSVALADRWRRVRNVAVGLLHVLARTPLDPYFTPEVFRVRGGG